MCVYEYTEYSMRIYVCICISVSGHLGLFMEDRDNMTTSPWRPHTEQNENFHFWYLKYI